MSRTKITEELRNTFQQILPTPVIDIIIGYLDLDLDLFLLWRNFILKQQQFICLNNNKIKVESKVMRHFEESFLTVLSALSNNENKAISFNLHPGDDSTQRTFDTALQALAFLVKNGTCSDSDHSYCIFRENYNFLEYLMTTGNISRDYDLNTFKDLEVYELYKEILLLLPDNEMFAVYRLGQQEQNILKEFLNSCFLNHSPNYPNAYLNEVKNMDFLLREQGLYVRKEGYIAWDVNYLKIAFLIESRNNRNLITILNKIPQFIKDANQIKARQLAPFNTLNDLKLLPSVLNSIIVDYDNRNLAGLASSLLSQLEELNYIYGSRVENFLKYSKVLSAPLSAVASDEVLEFTCGPYIVYLRSTSSYNLFLRFQELNDDPKEYEYKPIKLIENLINGQEIYGLVGDTFKGQKVKYSSVLDGLKNSYPDQADPKLDQFMSDLLDLAGVHTSLIVSKSLFGNECKTFFSLKSNSPMPERLSAEQELNAFLNKRVVDEKDSINFLMVEGADENRVKLFIKLKALKTLELLKMNYISMSIHLSPYYIDRVFERIPTSLRKHYSTTQVIISFFKNYYKIDQKNIEAVEPFQDYGSEIKLNKLAYDVLDKSANNKKFNSVIDTLIKLLMPLIEALKKFPYEKSKPVDNFIDTFTHDFEKISKTVDEKAILPNCVDCLKEWREQLNIIMNSPDLNTSFTGLHGFLSNPVKKLIQVIKKTEKEIENLEQSINSLLKKSSTGEIALMLHSLG